MAPFASQGIFLRSVKAATSIQESYPRPRVGNFYRTGKRRAYGFVMASNYNSKTRAAEVLIENGEAKLIRQREQFEDLIRGEIIPE